MTIDEEGEPHVSKSDEFSEKFQTAFDPHPSFLESYIADFATKVLMFIWRNFCVFHDPIYHEMDVAQMFNTVIG